VGELNHVACFRPSLLLFHLAERQGLRWMPHSQQSASEGAPSFDRIGFPTYQGNNREIRRSGRAHHRIYVEKTVYLSYFESNSLRNRTGN
jgi:hypothetical protein